MSGVGQTVARPLGAESPWLSGVGLVQLVIVTIYMDATVSIRGIK